MLRLITTLAPLFLTSNSSEPERNTPLLIFALVILILGAALMLIGLHIYLEKLISASAAYGIVGAIVLVVAAICLYSATRKPVKAYEKHPPAELANDPLAEFIPNELLSNPAVQTLSQKLRENPVSGTAAALTLGVVLARILARR